MKKLLLAFGALILGLSAQATQVVFDFATNDYGLERGDRYVNPGTVISSGDVQITLNGAEGKNNWRLWTDGLRAYSSGEPSFTIKTTNGQDINYVGWTLKNASIAIYPENSDTPLKDWSGAVKELTLVPKNTSGNNAILTLTVVYGDSSYEPEPEPETPEFTVAEALAWLNSGKTGPAIVSGVVTEVISYNSTYGSLTYNIGDSENATETLQIYSGLGLNGAKFTSLNDLVVGSKVQVKGNLKIYKNNNTGVSTPEMDLDNILLSLQLPDGYEKPAIPDAPEGVISVYEAINDYIMLGYTGTAVVRGYISYIEKFNDTYHSIYYYIKDQNNSQELYVYSGKWLDGADFDNIDQLEVGAMVEVEGNLQLYNNTPEIGQSSKILVYVPADQVGVESIFSDSSAPVEIYNLQGMKVANPAKGQLYILRQGDKTVKTIIR